MPDSKEIREKAYKDYKKGMSPADIAKKYNVSASTVRSWKSRYWLPEDNDNSLQQKSKNVATDKKRCNAEKKKPGGQPGNKNAIGNKGKPQPHNKNHWVHGIYEKIVFDTLPEEIKEFFKESEVNPRNEIIFAMKICDAEIYRLLKLMKLAEEKAGGVHIDKISKTDVKKGEESSYKSTTTKTISSAELVIRYRNEIQKYMKLKSKFLDSLLKMDMDEANLNSLERRDKANEDRLLLEKTKVKVLIQKVTGKLDLDTLIDDDVAELLEDIEL